MPRIKSTKPNIENEKIIKEIKTAQLEIKNAEKFFQYVSDPELVDVAIYDLEAKKSRYAYLIRQAKEKGIKNSLKDCLIEAIAK
jgi:translation elongation factor EF-G